MAELTDEVRKALGSKNFWAWRRSTPTARRRTRWSGCRSSDGKILVNTALGRKKPRNLETNPSVALSWFDPDNPYSTRSRIQGRVAETYTGDQAEADIDSAAKKYIDEDVYPWRKEGEHRVSYLIEPTHISAH